MFRLIAESKRAENNHVEIEARTLEEITEELYGYQPDHVAREYSYRTEEGYWLWWEDMTLHGCDSDVIGIRDEDGEIVEYQRTQPAPMTIEAVEKYAEHCLDTSTLVIYELYAGDTATENIALLLSQELYSAYDREAFDDKQDEEEMLEALPELMSTYEGLDEYRVACLLSNAQKHPAQEVQGKLMQAALTRNIKHPSALIGQLRASYGVNL